MVLDIWKIFLLFSYLIFKNFYFTLKLSLSQLFFLQGIHRTFLHVLNVYLVQLLERLFLFDNLVQFTFSFRKRSLLIQLILFYCFHLILKIFHLVALLLHKFLQKCVLPSEFIYDLLVVLLCFWVKLYNLTFELSVSLYYVSSQKVTHSFCPILTQILGRLCKRCDASLVFRLHLCK